MNLLSGRPETITRFFQNTFFLKVSIWIYMLRSPARSKYGERDSNPQITQDVFPVKRPPHHHFTKGGVHNLYVHKYQKKTIAFLLSLSREI